MRLYSCPFVKNTFLSLSRSSLLLSLFLYGTLGLFPLYGTQQWALRIETLDQNIKTLPNSFTGNRSSDMSELEDQVALLKSARSLIEGNTLQKEEAPPLISLTEQLLCEAFEKRYAVLQQQISSLEIFLSKPDFYIDVLKLQKDFLAWQVERQKARSSTRTENTLITEAPTLPPAPLPSSKSLTILPSVAESDFKLQLETSAHLETLTLARCTQLTEASLRSIGKRLPHLRILDLTRCTQASDLTITFLAEKLKSSLQKIILDGIPDLRRETFLKFKQAGIAFSPSDGAGEELDLSAQMIDDEDLAETLKQHPRTHTLILKGCDFLTDACLQHLQLLKGLEKLDVRGCSHITSSTVQELASKTSWALIEDPAPLPKLEPVVLDLSNKYVHDHELRIALGANSLINTLNLHACQIDFHLKSIVEKGRNLTSIDLYASRPSAEALQRFQELPNLTFLDLGHCNLKPEEIEKLRKLMPKVDIRV